MVSLSLLLPCREYIVPTSFFLPIFLGQGSWQALKCPGRKQIYRSKQMAIKVRIFKENNTRLWGLSSRERLRGCSPKLVLKASHGGAGPVAEDDSVLLLRGDFLYDQRIIQNMVGALVSSWRLIPPRGHDLSRHMLPENLPISMEADSH